MQLRADSINESERSIEAVLATENPVLIRDMATWQIMDEVLVMAGMRAVDQIPLLNNHSRWSLDDVFGSIRNMRVVGTELIVRLFFADMSAHKDDDRAKEIERAWTKVKQRHQREVSAGYRVYDSVLVPAGQSQMISGKRYTAGNRPLKVVTDWTPREGSLTPVAADPSATTRNEENQNVNKLLTYLYTIGLRADATVSDGWEFVSKLTDPAHRTHVRSMLDDTANGITAPENVRSAIATWQTPLPTAPTPTPPIGAGTGGTRSDVIPPNGTATAIVPLLATTGLLQPVDGNRSDAGMNSDAVQTLVANQLRLERERSTSITRTFQESGIENPPLMARAINEGWDAGRVSQELLPLVVGRSSEPLDNGNNFGGAPAIHSRENPSITALGMAMMRRSGMVGIDQLFRGDLARKYVNPLLLEDVNSESRQRAMEAADRELVNCRSLYDFCRRGLQLSGDRHQFVDGDEMIRTALSSSAVQSIFTTDINARLIASYNYAPDTTQAWTRESEVADFKTQTFHQLNGFGALTRSAPGKTADSMDGGAESYQARIFRYTGLFTVAEEDIINDHLMANNGTPEDMGRSANQVRPNLVYAILLKNPDYNGSALFASAVRNNLFSGAGDALSIASLEAAEAAMGDQRIGDRVLDLPLKFVIVPRQLKFTLKSILKSTELRDTTASTEYGTYNPLSDEDMTGIYDSRIGTKGVTDPATGTKYVGTATNWFGITARNAAARTIVVNYRRGTGRSPTIRSYKLDKGQWGFGWDICLDIGADAEDFRGMQKHAGA